MSTFQKTKLIDGRYWRYGTSSTTKRGAETLANQLRQTGMHNARVTKEESELGKTYYAVWMRKSARGRKRGKK